MTQTTRTEPVPPILRQEIRRASRLSHALSLFATRVGPNESRLDGTVAAGRLRDYLRTLEESLHAFSRSSFVKSEEETDDAAGGPSAPPATATRRASP